MKYLLIALLLVPVTAFTAIQEVFLDTNLGPLVGTLELPESKEVVAVALIIAGSGSTDRDGNIKGLPGKNNSLKKLAEALAYNGIASIRYDKRLIGDSASTVLREADIRFENYVSDAELWLEYLANNFDQPLIVIGHSEGALVGILAVQNVQVNGLISIAGVGRPASDILLNQLRNQLPAHLMAEAERIVASLIAGTTAEAPPQLGAVFRQGVQPYLISWFKYDPAEELGKLEIPVQIIQGTTDIQVSVSDAELLHAGAPESRLDLVEGMNHILKTVSGSLHTQTSSYSDSTLPLTTDLAPLIIEFIKKSALNFSAPE